MNNKSIIENAKLDLAPAVEYLKANETEIKTLESRLEELRRGLEKVYTGQVESAVDELQMIAYDYGDDHEEAETVLNEFEVSVNRLGLGVGMEGGYLWTPSTRSC